MPHAKVQTSPYLTLVRPGAESPVIYVSDTHGPEFPDTIGAPPGAVVGVVGLDREVVWSAHEVVARLLERAASMPVAVAELVGNFGQAAVDDALARNWLQDNSQLCKEYFVRTGQIEISAHCNWGCEFCPVATDPKPREVMPMGLFEEILDKLSVYDTMRYVTFHFFNEPTLDPLFSERIAALTRRGMKLELSSNLSALTPVKADLLEASGVMHHLVVNLPSLNAQTFAAMSGSKTYRHTLRNLDYVLKTASYPVGISVNGVGQAVMDNLKEIKERYEPLGADVFPTTTCDRAGTVAGEYAQNIFVEGPLRGCSWPVNHVYFSVRGDVFLCCNDYYQREVFGNIKDGSVHDIMTSTAAVGLRRQVFGVQDAPESFICRNCHDQCLDFVHRQFRPIATFPFAALRPV